MAIWKRYGTGHNYDIKFNADSTKANGGGSTSWQTEDDFDLKTKTNAKNKPKCALCGKEIPDQQQIAMETIDGTQLIFDTHVHNTFQEA